MNKVEDQKAKKVPGICIPLISFIVQGIGFATNWRGFYNKRRDKYKSNVYWSVVGVKAITILDQKGIEPLFDTSKVKKIYGFGYLKPVQARIGNIMPTIFTNDKIHSQQKDFLLTLMQQRSKDLLTDFDQISAPYFDKWEKKGGGFDWGAELNAFLSDFLFGWLLGAKPDPKDVEGWGLGIMPINPFRFPGQGDAPVIERMNRILDSMRSGSHFEAALKLASDKAKLDADETAKQMLFYFGFNAWAGLYSLIRSVIAEVMLNPEWHQKVIDEINSVVGEGENVSFSHLPKLVVLDAIIKETLRLHTPVPFVFAEARKDFVINSSSGNYMVKKGALLNGLVSHAHRDPDVFEQPDSFDPARFFKPEADKYLIWANGRDINDPTAQDHMCPGRDVVYQLVQLFCIKLLPNYTWTLKDKPRWNDKVLQSADRPETDFECTSFTRR